MDDLTGKGTDDELAAAEFIQLHTEVKRMLATFNITMSGADLDQVGKMLSEFIATGDFFTCAGSATVYTAAAADGRQAPTAYTDGMRMRVLPNVTNTGADPTINLNSLGAKTIKNEAGNAISAGDMTTTRYATLIYDGTYFRLTNASLDLSPLTGPVTAGDINGLLISNNAGTPDSEIDIGAGSARDSTDMYTMVGAAMTKDFLLDWALGDGNGGVASGLSGTGLQADEEYRLFQIGHTDGSVDYGLDTASDASGLLADTSGYTLYRQFGWVLTDASADIRHFIQSASDPSRIYWQAPTASKVYGASTLPTAQATVACFGAPDTIAMLSFRLHTVNTDVLYGLALPLAATDVVPTSVLNNMYAVFDAENPERITYDLEVVLDSASSYGIRFNDADGDLGVFDLGYVYDRGRG